MRSLNFLIIAALIFVSSCSSSEKEVSEQEKRKEDSLSRVKQRTSADSMKKKNPLLILPPETEYTGSYVDKYPSGVTKFKGFFRFGQRHGQWMSFYPNGIAWSEMHYDKGLRHGPNIAYFENGKKRFEGFYKNDKQDSVWYYYDSSGTLADKVLYRQSHIVKKLPLN